MDNEAKKGEELDFALGYFTVFPNGFPFDESSEDTGPCIWISEKCPEDMKKRLLETWETVKKETLKRHNQGEYSSHDYF